MILFIHTALGYIHMAIGNRFDAILFLLSSLFMIFFYIILQFSYLPLNLMLVSFLPQLFTLWFDKICKSTWIFANNLHTFLDSFLISLNMGLGYQLEPAFACHIINTSFDAASWITSWCNSVTVLLGWFCILSTKRNA